MQFFQTNDLFYTGRIYLENAKLFTDDVLWFMLTNFQTFLQGKGEKDVFMLLCAVLRQKMIQTPRAGKANDYLSGRDFQGGWH